VSEERREWMELVADLRKENERLMAELAERDAWHRAVMDETCGYDEKHCTCVPLLRREIEKLRAALTEAAIYLYSIMERRDGQLTGAAWGDVDNVRLDLLQAAKAGGGV